MTQHIITRKMLRDITSVREFNELIEQCVLSDEERAIIKMHYLEGKPLGYIADTLGYSESSIKRKHCRILARLQSLR